MDSLPLVKTSDINLAATLLVLGFAIDGTDTNNPKKVFFYFKETQKLKEAIDKYWRGDQRVNPKNFAYARKEIMVRIHENEDSQEYREE